MIKDGKLYLINTIFKDMAAIPSSAFVPHRSALLGHKHHHRPPSLGQRRLSPTKRTTFTIHAAKLPAGMEMPKVEPKFKPPFLGFTKTAEIWNSRACMMGLIGTFIVELILNKGILQMIGVEVGKGLDIPL